MVGRQKPWEWGLVVIVSKEGVVGRKTSHVGSALDGGPEVVASVVGVVHVALAKGLGDLLDDCFLDGINDVGSGRREGPRAKRLVVWRQ